MCFFKESIFPKKAKRDIICYKVCLYGPKSGIIETPHTGTLWDTQRESLKATDNFLKFLTKGILTREGVHSFSRKTLVFKSTYQRLPGLKVIVRCKIPKGTWYYENKEDGEYCSRSLECIDYHSEYDINFRKWFEKI